VSLVSVENKEAPDSERSSNRYAVACASRVQTNFDGGVEKVPRGNNPMIVAAFFEG
jgi:hypothetical protein